MNPVLLQSYQLGIGLGIVVLSTLMLFPGTKRNETSALNVGSDSTINDAASTGAGNSPNKSQATVTTKNTAVHSKERQSQTSQLSDIAKAGHDADPNSFFTPHRRLNWCVYILIYAVLVFVLFHSYSNHSENKNELPLYRRQLQNPTKLLSLAFEAYFPKEASVLYASNKKKK